MIPEWAHSTPILDDGKKRPLLAMRVWGGGVFFGGNEGKRRKMFKGFAGVRGGKNSQWDRTVFFLGH